MCKTKPKYVDNNLLNNFINVGKYLQFIIWVQQTKEKKPKSYVNVK